MNRRIVLNGRFLSRRSTGVDRFGREVLKVIDRLIGVGDTAVKGLDFEILVPPDGHESEFEHLSVRRAGKRQGQLWEQVDLPLAMAPGALLLNLCNTAPLLMPKQVVVIHDAATNAIPESYSWAFRNWYRVLMPLLGRRAARVLTVSDFSRKELVRAFRIPEHKLGVVKEGGEHVLGVGADTSILEAQGVRRPYVLAVSSMAVHKNFRLVLEALKHIDARPFDIVIAGGANARVFGDEGLVTTEDGVKWLGYVTDGQLRTLYENAMCFVFPSLYEGFGIPPLEAMHCGCPVVASTAASIPEVCGDAALYFDPKDSVALAEALCQVASDSALASDLRERGYRRTALFSWEEGARHILRECRNVLEGEM